MADTTITALPAFKSFDYLLRYSAWQDNSAGRARSSSPEYSSSGGTDDSHEDFSSDGTDDSPLPSAWQGNFYGRACSSLPEYSSSGGTDDSPEDFSSDGTDDSPLPSAWQGNFYGPPCSSLPEYSSSGGTDDSPEDFSSDSTDDLPLPLRCASVSLPHYSIYDDTNKEALYGGWRADEEKGWRVNKEKDGLRLFLPMPGLPKKNVHLSVEKNSLVLNGEANKKASDPATRYRCYSCRYELPKGRYQLDQIRAKLRNGLLEVALPKAKVNHIRENMKKGVLKIGKLNRIRANMKKVVHKRVIPRVEEEDRKDVFQVAIA